MLKLKVGDVVARKSYGYDVLFKVVNIYDEMVDLVGMTVRILADAPLVWWQQIKKNNLYYIKI